MRIKRTWRWMAASLMFLFLGVSFVACSQNGSGDAFEIHTERISFPAVAGSGEPFLAVGPDGSVYASWLENSGEDAHRFQFSRFLPATDSWTEPLTIAEGEDWFVNWADVPSIAIGSGGAMAAHWLARNEQGRYTYGIRVSISGDGGQSWTEPVWLHDDNSASEHGFAALTWLGDGSLSAVWLDGRKYAMGENEMTLRGRTISLNESGSAGITFSDEVLLDERTCDCCPNASLMTEAGTLVSVYRDRTEDEVRDVYAVRIWLYPGSRPREGRRRCWPLFRRMRGFRLELHRDWTRGHRPDVWRSS